MARLYSRNIATRQTQERHSGWSVQGFAWHGYCRPGNLNLRSLVREIGIWHPNYEFKSPWIKPIAPNTNFMSLEAT
jgi:hypothetical protein